MHHNQKILKGCAREALLGRYSTVILAAIIIQAIHFGGGMLTSGLFDVSTNIGLISGQLFDFLFAVFMTLFEAGYTLLFLNLSRKRSASMGDLFVFLRSQPDRILTAGTVLSLLDMIAQIPALYYTYTYAGPILTIQDNFRYMFTSLALLSLCGILGAILRLPFEMAFFLLCDDTQLDGIQALKKSLKLLKGSLGKLFLLQLSFIPLEMICICTCYVGYLFVSPYIRMSKTMFYRDLIGEDILSENGNGSKAAAL